MKEISYAGARLNSYVFQFIYCQYLSSLLDLSNMVKLHCRYTVVNYLCADNRKPCSETLYYPVSNCCFNVAAQ